jgi:hypothetical protein
MAQSRIARQSRRTPESGHNLWHTSRSARPRGMRSISSKYWGQEVIGERVGIRTRDPLLKRQMLYLLSYAP